jgi:K(+)-stimulated pyrophosphate-energized sodium pump
MRRQPLCSQAGRKRRVVLSLAAAAVLSLFWSNSVWAGDSDLVMPDLGAVTFNGVSGRSLLMWGMTVCVFGFLFGLVQLKSLQKLSVHKTMQEVSDLIYETCKIYLLTQAKFIIFLEVLTGLIIVGYFGGLRHFSVVKVISILVCSMLGILGSYGVSWFGICINNIANSRCAFASLQGKPLPVYSIPIKAGISIGMLLISTELFLMLAILLFVDPQLAGPCFIGFAIGESLGASVLRIAGGIFTKIADIGADLMKIVFNIKEDDARNPGVIADCAGDNAGDSVGPTADGFETYGVTAVALISFILLAVHDVTLQAQLLVWMFVVSLAMIIASALSYWINQAITNARYAKAVEMNYESPLTFLTLITAFVSIVFTYGVSFFLIKEIGDGTLWWKLASIISCGTIAGALIPEMVKFFTSLSSVFVHNVYHSSGKGGASLNILSGLTTGYFSAHAMGLVIVFLLGMSYLLSTLGLGNFMIAPAIFAFGLVAFGFLAMGPVTIAVDSYGPVSDNAQSVYELSLIEQQHKIKETIKRDFGFVPDFERAKYFLEANDGAGNTFKAAAKPVLIGTAVAGATTMTFSIIMILTDGLTVNIDKLSVLYPPFFLGLIMGGAIIYWFSGASIHAVTAGAYHAVEFIKSNMKLDGERASIEDSKKVVEICTRFAQQGMINLFLTVFFSALAFASLNPYFFIGYLVSIAIIGLFQAIFMANAGGAWDNAKKLVEVIHKEKGTDIHAVMVVGDTVGDPFKDTAAVALNPIIKFTTLFGLLAIEIAIELSRTVNIVLAAVFFAISLIFIWKSFHVLSD